MSVEASAHERICCTSGCFNSFFYKVFICSFKITISCNTYVFILCSHSQEFSIENTFLITWSFNFLVEIPNFGFSVTDHNVPFGHILIAHRPEVDGHFGIQKRTADRQQLLLTHKTPNRCGNRYYGPSLCSTAD